MSTSVLAAMEPGNEPTRVAQLAGYGSLIAMSRAFAEASTGTPAAVAKRLARRWR